MIRNVIIIFTTVIIVFFIAIFPFFNNSFEEIFKNACRDYDPDETRHLLEELIVTPMPRDANNIYARRISVFNTVVGVRFSCDMASAYDFFKSVPCFKEPVRLRNYHLNEIIPHDTFPALWWRRSDIAKKEIEGSAIWFKINYVYMCRFTAGPVTSNIDIDSVDFDQNWDVYLYFIIKRYSQPSRRTKKR